VTADNDDELQLTWLRLIRFARGLFSWGNANPNRCAKQEGDTSKYPQLAFCHA
jgi:hypothetical protein